MKYLNRFTRPIVFAALFAMALPVGAAIFLADHEASRREQAFVSALALQALARSEQTGDQILAGSRLIAKLPDEKICSPKGLALMRRIDLGSTLLQAVGHLKNNRVIDCSSVGDREPIDLGSPDLVSATGSPFWVDAKVFTSDHGYLVIGRGSVVGIVHKGLPLSFVNNVPGMVISTFSWTHRKPLITRGRLDPSWIASASNGTAFFRRNGYAVAIVKSKRYDIGAVAAVPLATTAQFASSQASILLPLGVGVGLLLAIFVSSTINRRLSMPGMIRSALRAKEFHLLYQPVVDLATGRTIGAEALIRWRRPDGAIVPPDAFIGVAEQAGVIRLITRRVLELLAEDVRCVLRVDPNFHFAVNFSADDIHSRDVCDEVKHFSARSGLPLDQLIIEATERSFVDVERARETIQELRSSGVRVAIDDFGTGYSSLGHLARLEIDYLKIDKLFVDSVGIDSATGQVAERIIDMAKDLKLQIVAEGIECRAQHAWLEKLGVEFGQGYYFARPLDVETLLQHLRADRKPTLIAQSHVTLAA